MENNTQLKEMIRSMGSSARHIFEDDKGTAVDCAIVGIIDSFEK